MEWQDEGLILGSRKHGETSVILELMTRNHGRHLGVVRGGRSTRMRPVIQPGNSVSASWRARLEEHLGVFQVEPTAIRAAELMANPTSVFGIQTLASHLRLLAEREKHIGLYDAGIIILDHLHDPVISSRLFVEFEMALLNELGFGLDLTCCADTGDTKNLTYVSPKTGRAVCETSGKPWHDRMLPLPQFLRPDYKTSEGLPQISSNSPALVRSELEEAFDLTLHFLSHHVYLPRNTKQPVERNRFVKTVLKELT